MFRRGGTVNDGIMTGLTDRKQLQNGTLNPEMIRGTTQNILSAMDEFAPMPKTRLPIGQFGLDIATGTPIGEALKSGYKTFTTQDDMRRAAMAKRKQKSRHEILGSSPRYLFAKSLTHHVDHLSKKSIDVVFLFPFWVMVLKPTCI